MEYENNLILKLQQAEKKRQEEERKRQEEENTKQIIYRDIDQKVNTQLKLLSLLYQNLDPEEGHLKSELDEASKLFIKLSDLREGASNAQEIRMIDLYKSRLEDWYRLVKNKHSNRKHQLSRQKLAVDISRKRNRVVRIEAISSESLANTDTGEQLITT